VFPGQFPVCCRIPVKALKMVVLPTLGLPARAMIGPSECSTPNWTQGCADAQHSYSIVISSFLPAAIQTGDADLRSLFLAQGDHRSANLVYGGVAEGASADGGHL